jgi:hypothetical protein
MWGQPPDDVFAGDVWKDIVNSWDVILLEITPLQQPLAAHELRHHCCKEPFYHWAHAAALLLSLMHEIFEIKMIKCIMYRSL